MATSYLLQEQPQHIGKQVAATVVGAATAVGATTIIGGLCSLYSGHCICHQCSNQKGIKEGTSSSGISCKRLKKVMEQM